MVNNIKKSGILLLILSLSILLVILVGCAGPATTSAPATTAAPPKTTATAAPATAAPPTTSAAPAPTSAAATTAASSGQKIVLTMAGTVPEADIKTRAVRQFIDEVQTKSNGRVQINLFQGGQLIADKDMVTAIPQGMADLAQCQMGGFSGIVAETQLMDLRFVYANEDHWFAVGQGKIGDIISQKLQSKANIKFLSWLAMGTADCWSSTNKVMKTPEDFKGVKFRVPPSALLVKAMSALGGNVVVISEGELYTALQSGVVSATLSMVGVYNDNKWYEVAPYVAQMPISPNASHSIVANLNSWNKLPPDIQQIIQTAASNATVWCRATTKTNNQNYWATVNKLKDSGKIKEIYQVPDTVITQFANIVIPVQKTVIESDPNMTPGVWDMVQAARP